MIIVVTGMVGGMAELIEALKNYDREQRLKNL
jgi:hypothetical protein